MLEPMTVVALREFDEAATTPSTNSVHETRAEDLMSTNWYVCDAMLLNTEKARALKYCCSKGKGVSGN